jgi:hypothetical protein
MGRVEITFGKGRLKRLPVRFTLRRTMVGIAVVASLVAIARPFIPRSCSISVSARDRTFWFVLNTPRGELVQLLRVTFEPKAVRVERITCSQLPDGSTRKDSHTNRWIGW